VLNEIISTAARIDSTSHTIEIDFSSNGEYETKGVLIDTDNNTETGHKNWLSETVMGFDLIIVNGYVSVYAGINGSDDSNWLEISFADQAVGSQARSDETFWSINTCIFETYRSAPTSSGGVLFYMADENDNYVAVESTLDEFVSEQPNIDCIADTTNTRRLLADVTAENLYFSFRQDQASTDYFFDDSAAAGLNIDDPAASGSGGGAITMLLPILGFFCVRRHRKFPLTSKVNIKWQSAFLIALMIVPVASNSAQESTVFDDQYHVQFTEPRAGKIWIDVRGATTANERVLMEALLSSALVKINRTIWNDLEEGLPIRVKRCGNSNASYDPNLKEIVLCWELYEQVTQAFAALPLDNAAPKDLARGFLVFVMYHEFAHAIADLRGTPDVGNRESNADALATVLSVEQGYSPFAFVAGILFQFTGESTFGSIHPGNRQRSGDLICWATGGDEQTREIPAYNVYQPIFDAEGRDCVAEYQANRQLIVDIFPDFIESSLGSNSR